MDRPLVPDDFTVPQELATPEFRLEPLGPGHNAADHAAWTGSIAHIRSTPGFAGRSWPPTQAPPPEANLASLRRHAEDFDRRTGFAYAVLDPRTGEMIGCVYLYPPRTDAYDVDVRSWVRADRAGLDVPLYETVTAWLAARWPFERADYAPR